MLTSILILQSIACFYIQVPVGYKFLNGNHDQGKPFVFYQRKDGKRILRAESHELQLDSSGKVQWSLPFKLGNEYVLFKLQSLSEPMMNSDQKYQVEYESTMYRITGDKLSKLEKHTDVYKASEKRNASHNTIAYQLIYGRAVTYNALQEIPWRKAYNYNVPFADIPVAISPDRTLGLLGPGTLELFRLADGKEPARIWEKLYMKNMMYSESFFFISNNLVAINFREEGDHGEPTYVATKYDLDKHKFLEIEKGKCLLRPMPVIKDFESMLASMSSNSCVGR